MNKEIPQLNGEMWLPVLKLFSCNSDWSRDKEYTFELGKYFISNKGRFKSRGKIIKGNIDQKGYVVVSLNYKRFKVHQIVMQTFNPDGYFIGSSVDHINKNAKHDNSIENLRWASKDTQFKNRENGSYKTRRVLCTTNNVIYDSCVSAEIALNLVRNTVARVARGERSIIRGYKFVFVD